MLSTKDQLDRYSPVRIAEGIAGRVRGERLRQNLTQLALAKRSGVSLGSLKRFEKEAEISLKNLLLLAAALDATDAFHLLFEEVAYESIDDILEERQVKYRKRGRIND